MMARVFTTCATFLVIAGVAAAEVPANWQNYFDGPAGFLLTKKEKKEWKKGVKTAEQAEHFIELFWAKRDPYLETPLNEFVQGFSLRVEAADEAFGTDKQRGALTDRGRVLILLGRPAQRIERHPGADAGGVGGADPWGGGGADDHRVARPASLGEVDAPA